MLNLPTGFTPKMVAAAESLFVAKALEETIRPVVEGFEQEILSRLQLRTDKRYAIHGIDRVVLDRKHTYLLAPDDLAIFLEETFSAAKKANLKVASPENCPLLEAEYVRMKKENELLEALGQHPSLGSFKNFRSMSLEARAQAIELSLRLLAPFVRKAPELLESLMLPEHAAGH